MALQPNRQTLIMDQRESIVSRARRCYLLAVEIAAAAAPNALRSGVRQRVAARV